MSKPVYIYWLLDTRPDTIAKGYHSGFPFYCGKTIHPPEKRLQQHLWAAWRHPARKLSQRLRSCFMGDNIRVQIVEVVPPGSDWEERERSWIRVLRFSFGEGNCNIAAGGQSDFDWMKKCPISKRLARKRRAIKRKQREIALKNRQKPYSRLVTRRKYLAEAAASKARRDAKLAASKTLP